MHYPVEINVKLNTTFSTIFWCLQMYEKYKDYATDAEREILATKLQETEDWLYNEGEDETKGVYVSKLIELKKVGIATSFLFLKCILKLHV